MEQSKELQAEIEKLKAEKVEELNKQREVSFSSLVPSLPATGVVRLHLHCEPYVHLCILTGISLAIREGYWSFKVGTLIGVQARLRPDTPEKLIEYFLETESGEMQFETARMRPLLTDHFFDTLSNEISKSPGSHVGGTLLLQRPETSALP